jgi:hypothetical protein
VSETTNRPGQDGLSPDLPSELPPDVPAWGHDATPPAILHAGEGG